MKRSEIWEALQTLSELRREAPPLLRRAQGKPAPLSFPQERLWWLDQLAPSNAAHNLPFAFRLRGPLNQLALKQSLREIWQRHEVLRSVVSPLDGRFVQLIAPRLHFAMPVTDLRGIFSDDREKHISLAADREASRPFDLRKGPLLRIKLLRVAEDDSVLLMVFHHIIFDFWSTGVLFRELNRLYAAFAANQPSPLPDLPIQYADFAIWQREWLSQAPDRFLETLLSCAKDQLGNDAGVGNLASGSRRPLFTGRRGGSRRFVVPPPITKGLKELAHREGVTLFTTLLTAFKVLLRHRSQPAGESSAVCIPVANRYRSETDALIGYFVNLLIVRGDSSGDPSFLEFQERVCKVLFRAYAYQDLPVHFLDAFDAARAPLNQSMFALLNTHSQSLKLPGVSVSSLEVDSGIVDFDLFLYMFEGPETLTGVLRYDAECFDHATIARIVQHFQVLLEHVVRDPSRSLSLLRSLCETDAQEFPRESFNLSAAAAAPRERSAANSFAEKPVSISDLAGRLRLFITGETNSIPPSTVQAQWQTTRPADRLSFLTAFLTSEAARVLGLSPTQIDPQQSLISLGLDSLKAVRLKHRLETELGVAWPPAKFLDDLSVLRLAKLLNEKPAETRLALPVPRKEADIPKVYPLSHGQRALWFLHRNAPESAAYNTALAMRIRSPLNVSAVRKALNELVAYHPCLRTTFTVKGGQPIQEVHDNAEICVEERDASAWSLESLSQQIADACQRPFNLALGPVVRASLFTRSVDDHIFMLAVHHIVVDLWSMRLLLDSWREQYLAAVAGARLALPPLGHSYADFVRWQADMLRGPAGREFSAYWRGQLAGELPVLNLPTDRPRPAVQSYRGASHRCRLPEEIVRGLREVSRAQGTTFYMTLLAAFQVLLHRHTCQEDLLVGTPTSGRGQPGFSNIVGYFVNPVVLRANLSGDPTFKTFLQQVRKTVLDALNYQDYPFTMVVERLQPKREASRSPVFQVMFALEEPFDFKDGEWPASDDKHFLKLEPFDVAQQEGQFDLTLELVEFSDSLLAFFKYNSDLFDAPTIERMAGHFQTLLAAIAKDPGQPVSKLPLLTERERGQMLVHWNDTRADYPQEKCVHELFEDRARKNPEALAVVFQNQRLSYGELDRRAGQLARHLRSWGVGPDVLVGLCVERSIEMIVGLLGILKAGGAYVPFDPNYPAERLEFMLMDSAVSFFVSQEELRPAIPQGLGGARTVCLDRDWSEISRQSPSSPMTGVTPRNLAYLIYTSGSTGKPKGVLIEHKGLCNLAAEQMRVFDLRPESHVLQFASLSFDASIFEIVMALCSGAALYLAGRATPVPVLALLEILRDHAITHVTLPPSVLAALPRQELPALRTVIAAGEVCRPDVVARWAQGRRFFNAYGPTEATVWATVAECGSTGLKPTIGRPIGNTRVHILDRRLQPVPIGVTGELHIGGVGLARGYLNHPELSEEKFIPNPFCAEPMGRLYKTGDLARYLPNGEIEFIGRLDHQVKVRGFRIEPGEVEGALAQHPAVQDAVVVARGHGPGDVRLVGYVVSKRNVNLLIPDLRRFLNGKLPHYMIPSVFVMMKSLPLTPSGKVDRQALPTPEPERPELKQPYVPPANPVEQLLAGIWSEVLRIQKVGTQDNFFESGGDSILSLQIVARAKQAGLDLSPVQLFQHQTIAELAGVAIAADRATLVKPDSPAGSAPLTPIQHYFFEQNHPHPDYWNMAMALEPRRGLDPVPLRQAFEGLLAHHDALRMRFVQTQQGWQQGHAGPDEPISFEHVAWADLSEAKQLAAWETKAAVLQGSLSLSQGPLLRAALFDFGSTQPSRLLIIIHHLVVDGVSWRILLEDLQTAYQQLSSGEPIKLPVKTTSFKSWSEQLTATADSELFSKERDYWLTVATSLHGRLPRDLSRGANTELSVRTISVSVTAENTKALLREVPRVYHTQINEVLLAAVVQAFSNWTGAQSLSLHLEGHGRENVIDGMDLSRTVGWFTTLFPVRLSIPKGSDPGRVLQSVKEQLRSVPNRGIGYGLLHYLSADTRLRAQLRSMPRPEVCFNYLGQFDQVFSASAFRGSRCEFLRSTRSPENCRDHLIDINALVIRGRLLVDWSFSANIHRRSTIERLAKDFIKALQATIASCQSEEAGGFTPSDFPEAFLNQRQLDELLAKLDQS